MAKEENKPARFETTGSATLKKLFVRKCKKLGVSQKERIHQLLKADTKGMK